MKEFIHYGQLISQDYNVEFVQFSYGCITNMQKYGLCVPPPAYNLTLVTCPVHIYYGDKDEFAKVENIDELISHLPNSTATLLQGYVHLDFFLDPNVELYESMIEVMTKS